MSVRSLAVAGTGVAGLLSAAAAAAVVWLLVTEPFTIASLVASRDITGGIRVLAAAWLSLLSRAASLL